MFYNQLFLFLCRFSGPHEFAAVIDFNGGDVFASILVSERRWKKKSVYSPSFFNLALTVANGISLTLLERMDLKSALFQTRSCQV